MPLTADDHRKLAGEYEKLARFATTLEDREKLRRLRQDHLANAKKIEWESGHPAPTALAEIEAGEWER
ncbi:MAG: hypothetical protein AB7K35_13700 [Pseudorhodoplanes sp.]